jgi:hypothetical protein
MTLGVTLRRRIAVAMILRSRTSVAGFALPGLRDENLELSPLSRWEGFGRELASEAR